MMGVGSQCGKMLFVVPTKGLVTVDKVIRIVGVGTVAVQPHLQCVSGKQLGAHFERELNIGKLLGFHDAHATTLWPGLQCGDDQLQPGGEGAHTDSDCSPSQLCSISRAIFQSNAASSSAITAALSTGSGCACNAAERAWR